MTDIEKAPIYSFIFPGQGAQKVGMGRSLYETSQAARDVFDEADDSLGASLTSVMFDGPLGNPAGHRLRSTRHHDGQHRHLAGVAGIPGSRRPPTPRPSRATAWESTLQWLSAG